MCLIGLGSRYRICEPRSGTTYPCSLGPARPERGETIKKRRRRFYIKFNKVPQNTISNFLNAISFFLGLTETPS